MRVGFIGLGNMGRGMATRVQQAEYPLTVYDIRRDAAQPFLDAGASWADTPKAVAEASDIILTSLPNPQDVEQVALGENGIIEGISPGAVFVDLSTNSPTVVRHIYARFRERGAYMMDGPVSGGPTGARTGKLAIMVGGDDEAFQKCRAVLEAIGDRVSHTGSIGSGSICKLMHNCIGYGLQTIVAECFTLGVKVGVEPKALWQAICDGAVGRAGLLHRTMPETYLQGRFDPPNFALRLAFKDVGLATQLGREYQVPMAVANLTYQELMAAMNRGWADRDSRIAMTLQEERAGGVEVRIPELREGQSG